MSNEKMPRQYLKIKKRFKGVHTAVENLGKALRKAGPLDEKTSHLVQLAAAAAIKSEGSVHSHTRRALAAGASHEEIHHTLILMTSIVGFPNVSAALSWADEVLEEEQPS